MEFIIKGEFYRGLNVYKNNELLLYSKFKHRWFRGDLISIFDKDDNLLVEVSVSGMENSEYLIRYQNKDLLETILSLSRNEIMFSRNIRFKLSQAWLALINPYARVYYEEKEIAKINLERFMTFRQFSLHLKDENFIYINELLVYFLLNQTRDNTE
ncbi:hypothetical protein [Flavobacterium microcysteis]|uniref:Uncharacterized protein n=1 Tax=Flavobacterium microcysteis TaxID=2596891 RepID=A0A501PYS0_9FLAO|nr:hypothetical protein [Flavobacterium microcysteis]TPD65358.1 hypothetical protein FJA49_14255 [Flavobacterium microcysteis]